MSNRLNWLISQEDHTGQAHSVDDKKVTTKVTTDGIETGEPSEAKSINDIFDDINANPDKKPGHAIGEVSVEDNSPNTPVAGGKMPGESQMDEDPRGSLEHADAKKEGLTVETTDLDTPETDEANVEKDKDIGLSDKNAKPHTPGQTKEAQKALGVKGDSVSLEDNNEANNETGAAAGTQAGDDTGTVEQPGVGDVPADAAPTGEEPQSALADEILNIENDVHDEVLEASEHVEQVANDIEDLEVIQASVEQYAAILQQSADKNEGVIDPLLARTVAIGLEHFNMPLFTGVIASAESFNDPEGRLVVSTEAIDGLKAKSAKLAEGIKAAAEKLWNWLVDLWNAMTADKEKLRERQKALVEKANGIQKENPKDFMLKGANRLYVNNFFVGDKAEAMKDIVKVGQNFLVDYPRVVSKVLTGYTNKLKGKLNISGQMAQELAYQAYKENFHFEAMGLKPMMPQNAPSEFKKFKFIGQSAILPGNKAMYAGLAEIHPQEEKTNQHSAEFYTPNAVFKMSFANVADVKATNPEEKIKAPSKGGILTMLTGLQAIIEVFDDVDKAKDELGKAKKEMQDRIATLSLLSGFQGSMALHMMGATLTNNAMTPVGNFSGYLNSIAKIYLAVIEGYINHHLGAEERAEAA